MKEVGYLSDVQRDIETDLYMSRTDDKPINEDKRTLEKCEVLLDSISFDRLFETLETVRETLLGIGIDVPCDLDKAKADFDRLYDELNGALAEME